MQVSDKLIKPLTEAKYLNADNVSRYRCIMRIFFEHYEKLKYWLYQEEVYEEMIKDPFFADYRPEQCQQDLTMLTEWKNLNTIQDTKKVASIEEFKNKKYRYVCMNGQPRLAGLMALDLFAKSETRVYYAGDLDPEGVLIAQKLSQYYKGEFYYWHMEADDYERCRSEEVISPKRLKILERIKDERLKPVAALIKKFRTAGYQEMLAEEML